jgi:hypothetical protein
VAGAGLMSGRDILLRAALLYGAFVNASVGVWATVAPRAWYEDFPGFGRVWVAIDGPYNEHLARDIGALGIGMAIVLVAAAWSLARPLLIAAGLAMTATSVPHAIYHSRHLDVYDATSDKVASVGGLWLAAGVSLAVLVAALARPAATPTREPPVDSRPTP